MTKSVSRPVRVVSSTISGRAFNFNQVVMERDDPPDGLLLVGIDPDYGISLWLRPYADVAAVTKIQVEGYSRHLRFDVDQPPPEVGDPVRISAAVIDAIRAGLWAEILEASTNTKNKLVRETFSWF